MWLPDKQSLRAAAQSARAAIEMWQRESGKSCALDDEVLAHIYLATARLKLGEIEGAMEAVAPAMHLPTKRKTSWMRKRVANLRAILDSRHFGDSGLADIARQQLHEFEGN
jgi:hypothetical protein